MIKFKQYPHKKKKILLIVQKGVVFMELYNFNHHPVIQIDGEYYIIDTGSPNSFKFDGTRSMRLCGQSFYLITTPYKKEDFDSLTGSDISGLIGTNVFSRTGLSIDLENRTLEFSSDDQIAPGESVATLSFDFYDGQYVTTNDICLANPLKNAIIDTGAPISYISQRFLSELTPTGELYEDFSPIFGDIRGEYYDCNFFLKGSQTARPLKVGTDLQMLNDSYEYDAVLGISALTDKKIVFDFEHRKIHVAI